MTSPDPSRDRPVAPAAAAGDPSMEDILASIRRILSEDEPATVARSAGTHPAGDGATDDDVLVLDASMMVPDPNPPVSEPEATYTNPVQAEPVRNVAFPAPPPAVEPVRAPQPESLRDLLAPEAAAAATASVGSLVRTIVAERSMQVYSGGPTIEDIVRAEVRPLLAQWLDENLPPMVERLVRLELERVVGRATS